MAHATADQQLLYALRSPTTPLDDKVQRAASALDLEPTSTSLPPLVRDWALDYLVRATRSGAGEAALTSAPLWSLLARATDATPSTAANTPPLAIFVAFVGLYSARAADVGLLRSAASVWRKLAAVAMRKATVDQALEGYEKLVAASLKVCGKERAAVEAAASAEEQALWQDLGVNWLKPLRSMVLDAGKGGKKIPAHALSLLPSLLPLLSALPPASPFRTSLLETVQLAIFNVENLKRGLARDSYAAGSVEQSTVSTADSELLAALASLPPAILPSSYAALPSFTHIYASALAAHAAILFPLPAKANFPTPSAQKSALEVLGLAKRRELAGRWLKRVIAHLEWSPAGDARRADSALVAAGEGAKASSLAGVLEEVERADLYRAGQAEESWDGVLAVVVDGAATRLEQSATDAPARDALVGVLALVSRIDHAALEPRVPRVLAVLARAPSATAPVSVATATSTFLSDLISFHSRSLSLPTFLSLLSDALASTSTPPSSSHAVTATANSVLTSPAFLELLDHAVSGMTTGSTAIRATFENLVAPIRAALAPAGAPTSTLEEVAPSPTKKRKLSSASAPTSDTSGAASRLRIATVYVRGVPAAALATLVEPLKVFIEEVVDSRLEDFAKASRTVAPSVAVVDNGTPGKKDKKRRRASSAVAVAERELDSEARLGVELLELRYAAVERLRCEGLLEDENWWEVRATRRDGLREVVEAGVGESAVEATRTLLQHFEFSSPTEIVHDEAQAVIAALLVRISSGSNEQTWTGFLRELDVREVPVALWELVARRWLPVLSVYASDDQLEQVAAHVVAALNAGPSARASAFTWASTTRALLHRADFWELARLRTHVQAALVRLVAQSSVSTSTEALSALKTGDTISRANIPSLVSAARHVPAILAAVPLEYLRKDLRIELADRVLVLDLLISASALDDAEKETIQDHLRRFIAAMSVPIPSSTDVFEQLMEHALPGSRAATVALYRTAVIDLAVSTFKISQSVDELVALVQSFGEKPLQSLSKNVKRGAHLDFQLTAREQAYLALCASLVLAVPDSTEIPTQLAAALKSSVKRASKALDGSLLESLAALQRDQRAVLGVADVVEACRSMWLVRDWLSMCSLKDSSVYADFSQAALVSALVHLRAVAADPTAVAISSSVLGLLSYRVERRRKSAEDVKESSELFETLVAAHLAVRSALATDDALDSALARAASAATVEEYGAALDSLASLLAATGEAVSPANPTSMARLEHTLAVIQVFVLHGPEGSSRVASTALSEVLRQLALVVEHLEGSHNGAVKVYSLTARFLDSVCGERPLLLSRFNISSVLSIVSHILRPSAAASGSPSSSVEAQAASQLYQTLVAAVGHVVRHRKDHVVPLFPLLIAILSNLLSVLRRAGLGTLGTSLDEVESSASLGQRAEREARTTFPAWAWAGGAQAVGKAEAKALGRLLGSLTAKTTTTTAGKRKHGAADDSSSTNTSLAAPLSKHAPFLLLNYLRACVHPTCPIPSALRTELQGGWFEVMDAMGKWEREALMKGMLGEDEEAERGVLRDMWKSWEKERYRG
ncbi:hypothetical protein JCM9279_003334 [Rhodotorula babjevae]